MRISETTILLPEQKPELLRLWNDEYPTELRYYSVDELDKYLQGLGHPVHYLLADDDGAIAGWAWTFDREGQRWFAIILDSSIQRQGYGSLLLSRLKQKETILLGWVTDSNDKVKNNGTPYLSPIEFYRKNDFQVCSSERLETDKLSAVKIKWERK